MRTYFGFDAYLEHIVGQARHLLGDGLQHIVYVEWLLEECQPKISALL